MRKKNLYFFLSLDFADWYRPLWFLTELPLGMWSAPSDYDLCSLSCPHHSEVRILRTVWNNESKHCLPASLCHHSRLQGWLRWGSSSRDRWLKTHLPCSPSASSQQRKSLNSVFSLRFHKSSPKQCYYYFLTWDSRLIHFSPLWL